MSEVKVIKKSELLRLTLPFLWSGLADRDSTRKNSEFICNALALAVRPLIGDACLEEAEVLFAKQKAITDHIKEELGYQHTVRSFMTERGMVVTSEACQAYRHAWVGRMIRQFEAEGD